MQIQCSVKIHSLGVELFQAGGQTHTGVTKFIVVFRHFWNAPKKRTPLLTGRDNMSISKGILLYLHSSVV